MRKALTHWDCLKWFSTQDLLWVKTDLQPWKDVKSLYKHLDKEQCLWSSWFMVFTVHRSPIVTSSYIREKKHPQKLSCCIIHKQLSFLPKKTKRLSEPQHVRRLTAIMMLVVWMVSNWNTVRMFRYVVASLRGNPRISHLQASLISAIQSTSISHNASVLQTPISTITACYHHLWVTGTDNLKLPSGSFRAAVFSALPN